MLLYLTSNQKSNLIDPAVRNMTLPAKKLVGRFSLKSFVTKDMRNYANAKFFVVDAACIEESGNDFTLAQQHCGNHNYHNGGCAKNGQQLLVFCTHLKTSLYGNFILK